jgi:hypothetical protein
MQTILGKPFLLVRAYRTDVLSWYHIFILHREMKLRIFNSAKMTAKRITLNRSLNRLNLKTGQKLLSSSDSHKSLVLSQTLEFNHLSESLGSSLPVWYFEFPQFSLGIRIKYQISHVSSFCPETEISATPSTFRDHYS